MVALRVLAHQGEVEILAPELVIEEFERNRERIETSMTASVAQRFKLINQDLDDYGGANLQHAAEVIADLAHDLPLIGAMTTRNFDEVLQLLRNGRRVEATDAEHSAVVRRGTIKRAALHRSRNSVADALLVEPYATDTRAMDLSRNPHALVTSNSDDFSAQGGDARQPHPAIAGVFATEGSTYGLEVNGLNAALLSHFGNKIEEASSRRRAGCSAASGTSRIPGNREFARQARQPRPS